MKRTKFYVPKKILELGVIQESLINEIADNRREFLRLTRKLRGIEHQIAEQMKIWHNK